MKYHPQTHILLRPNLGVLQIGIKSQGYREPDHVMSDSEDSTITYMSVSSSFGGLSYIGSSGVDGPPMMPEDPYAYVVAAFQALLSPDYFMPPDDDVLPAEEQPLPAAVSPTADSPGYIPESYLEEYLEEDDDEDPKEDPANYPTDRDDEEKEPFGDKDDDEDEDEDDEEEEEHPASADSVLPPIARLLAIPSPPASPLSPWSSPLPQIPSPPLPVSSPVPVSPLPLPASPTYPLGYRAAMIRLRAETPSTSHPLPLSTPPSGTPPLLPIPLPTPSPPLLLPSTDCRAGVFEVTLPPQKRLCIALGLRYEVGESSFTPIARPTGGFRVDYGFVATLDDEIKRDPERDAGYGITDPWDEIIDTYEIYGRLDEAQDARAVLSGRLNLLQRDRCSHAYTALLMEREVRLSQNGTKKSHKVNTSHKNHPTTSVTDEKIKRLIKQGVADALAAWDANRSINGDDNHNSDTGVRRQAPPARECTYPDFMKCKPLYFKGTEGVVELTQWFERMETVFHISNCSVENQIKFSTCTLLGSALMWWNSYVKIVGHDVAYAMTWTDLKKKTTNKYCPRGEIKKHETEMWNLKVKESDKIEKYIGRLPNMIYGSVMASKQKTMQDRIEFATELMDKKIYTFVERQRFGKKKPYRGSKPLCSKCNYHHDGQCQKPTCYECGAQGHFKRDCPKLKNNNRGIQGRNGNASTKVYAIGRAGTNPDSNVVTSTLLLNNRYASVLFDIGADRSFMSTAFSSQIDITPSTLDHYSDVELANGRIVRLNGIIRGCTLNFLNHPFNIDLMPIELGSLDVIIGMDWLAKYQAVIVYAEKIVHTPWGNETLIIRGDERD
ncbi:putative reverse transcriptase domain-containing protein [Tanacetum coccineum]